ncbi:hypothetical protein ACVWWQ_000751 [Rhodanobacter sp. TND4EL1]
MTTRSRGPLAGFGWLKRGISVAFRHPKSLFGGSAILALACFLPSLISLPLQLNALRTGTPLSPATSIWIMAISMLFGLLLIPLYAGYLQMIDAAERELPSRARDIFKPYRQGEALRLIGFGLAVLVIYVALIGIIILATGSGIASWYMQALAAQANHQPPPGLPSGFGVVMALCMVFGLFMMGFYAISFGQVALGRRSVPGAIGDGVKGALKNLLPLIVFAVSLILVWIAVAIGFAIVAIALSLLGKLIGAWVVLVLLVPLYIALLLVMFAVMFGVMYYLWRDVCDDDTVPGMAPAIAA